LEESLVGNVRCFLLLRQLVLRRDWHPEFGKTIVVVVVVEGFCRMINDFAVFLTGWIKSYDAQITVCIGAGADFLKETESKLR